MYKKVSIIVRPLPNVQDERHRPGLDHRKWLLGLEILLRVSGHGRPVHVPPRLSLSDWRWPHHQQVLQVLTAGQLATVLTPVRFGHGVPVLVLLWLIVIVVRRRFDCRRRRHARHVILVAVVLGKVVGLVYL